MWSPRAIRAERAGRPLQLAPTAPGGLVRRCVELLNNQADARGVTIRTRIADELPEIECDAEQLTQALLNLLLNAIQILDAGGQVDVSAHMQDDGLHIAVADNGPGIDPEYREQLFDPFVYQREAAPAWAWRSCVRSSRHTAVLSPYSMHPSAAAPSSRWSCRFRPRSHEQQTRSRR